MNLDRLEADPIPDAVTPSRLTSSCIKVTVTLGGMEVVPAIAGVTLGEREVDRTISTVTLACLIT